MIKSQIAHALPTSSFEKRKSMATSTFSKQQNPSPSNSHLTGSTLASHQPINASDRASFDDHLSRTTTSSGLTISSNLYIEPEYDVKLVLNFNQHEIKLIRSTWLEMINDDINKNYNTSESNAQTTSINHSSIASSLFCIQFYSNLLSMDSNLERMFPSIKHQAVSFAGVLSTAIHNLDNLKALDDYLQNLGKRHSRILGIDPPHFELMGIALLKTFQDRFGYNFTLELERCWSRLYTYLANSILQFGIDPVLKIEKINQDWETVTLSRSISNSSFEKPNFSQTHSTDYNSDAKSIDTQPTITQNQRLRQPSNPNLNAGFQNGNSSPKPISKLDPSSKTYSIGARHLGKKTMKNRVNSGATSINSATTGTTSTSAGSEEEKCVIM
ncbi:Flavohemoprotein [Wickerhamomyces ciferrii]|uniref:Flavohemoprotein n=1 Tax=Wickerhamomyces ciferrii (strain ATCC 14091 / BCRC 22168 / CBS 111 / JCM 3599 / NBRC 0793 / NRRL Y-1031 F-60-10) TaxID=1206466 RepID=K0KNH8_WICCF|nr:Flavohemoprotein [Wickerhamomyces ciferrii]CCH44551.1 Flavohemoprotein [Wickerhamomyces ciferrii]